VRKIHLANDQNISLDDLPGAKPPKRDPPDPNEAPTGSVYAGCRGAGAYGAAVDLAAEASYLADKVGASRKSVRDVSADETAALTSAGKSALTIWDSTYRAWTGAAYSYRLPRQVKGMDEWRYFASPSSSISAPDLAIGDLVPGDMGDQ
jgi:hypothetical protein